MPRAVECGVRESKVLGEMVRRMLAIDVKETDAFARRLSKQLVGLQ